MPEKPSASARNPGLPPAPGQIIAVHVIPKSKENAIEGFQTDAAGQKWLRVRLTAAPTDGKANKALLRFLGKQWGVPPSSIVIVFGETSRHKRLKIAG